MKKVFPLLAGWLALTPLQADETVVAIEIAADYSVPLVMDHGGTSEMLAAYILGDNGPINHTAFAGEIVTVGNTNPYNYLLIRHGSTVESGALFLGGTSGSLGNRALLMENSTLNVSMSVVVGVEGGGNILQIYDSVLNSEDALIGAQAGSNGNSVLLSGPAARWNNTGAGFLIGNESADNAVYLSHGAELHTQNQAAVGVMGEDNSVELSGDETLWYHQGDLFIGYFGTDNSVILEDRALLALDGGLNIESSSNFLGIDGGFFAWQGNNVAELENLILDGYILQWDPYLEEWKTGVLEDFSYAYFSDEAAAEAFSGYEGLAGYTLLTITAVPEPTTYALLGGVALLGVVVRRRRCRT